MFTLFFNILFKKFVGILNISSTWFSHLSLSHSSSTYRSLSLYRILLMLSLTLSSVFIALPALAIPPTQSTSQNASNSSTAQQNAQIDPQVAPTPESPFIYPTTGTTASTVTAQENTQNPLIEPVPNPLNNPATLASQMQPTDNTLSQANQELLSRNAQLQRDVNDLQTQVNVLVEERSGQLFMYGAFTVAVSLLLGFLMGWLMFGRRDRW